MCHHVSVIHDLYQNQFFKLIFQTKWINLIIWAIVHVSNKVLLKMNASIDYPYYLFSYVKRYTKNNNIYFMLSFEFNNYIFGKKSLWPWYIKCVCLYIRFRSFENLYPYPLKWKISFYPSYFRDLVKPIQLCQQYTIDHSVRCKTVYNDFQYHCLPVWHVS